MNTVLRFFWIAILLATTTNSTSAHHSAAMFNKPEVTMQGVVKQFQFINPHAWLIVTVEDEDGESTDWALEMNATNLLQRQGIHKTTFPVGTEITFMSRPINDGRPASLLKKVVFADGTTLDL